MRAIAALETVFGQSLSVVGVLVGGIIAFSQGAAWGGALTIGATITLLGLALVGAALERRKRECALDLIIAGPERVPLAAVQRQRQRLLARRTRDALARRLAAMIVEANRPRPPVRGMRPLFDISVVATVAPDLRAVTQALQIDHPPARAVALAERLLTDGASPLYGDQVAPLREELQRLCHLLKG